MPAPASRRRSAIRSNLLRWFDAHRRDLPWRRTSDPYCVWLSEIMLQQTRVEAVEPYYRRFLDAFPTVWDLAAAPGDRVMKLWEGLGYYSRARNLCKAAKLVCAEMNGKFPDSVERLQALPGIGRYTAGAIASIAFGVRAPILDGNVKRVLARLYDIDEPIEKQSTVNRMWELAEELVPRKRPGDFNQAMMELGARLCLPKRPRCQDCPVSSHCHAFESGSQLELPVRKPKKDRTHYQIVVGVARRDERVLIGRRPPKGLLGGLWEFPGGKIENGETHEAALKREFIEECGLRIEVGEKIATVDHGYSHFSVTLHVYRCKASQGRARANYHDRLKWVWAKDLKNYAFPTANRKFLDKT